MAVERFLVKIQWHIFVYNVCGYMYTNSHIDIFDPKWCSLYGVHRCALYNKVSAYNVKPIKFKIQGPWLARAPSKALGEALNKYLLSYLILYS